MMEEVKHSKCGRCKCWREDNSFLNDKGRRLKTCSVCRKKAKEKRKQSKCEHNKQKATCKVCNPVGHIKTIMYNLMRKKLGNYYNPSITKEEYLGIDGNRFLKYIDTLRREGMTWQNHAKEWSISYDVVPETYFITKEMTLSEIKKITNYKNISVMFGVHPLSPHYNPNIDPNTGEARKV